MKKRLFSALLSLSLICFMQISAKAELLRGPGDEFLKRLIENYKEYFDTEKHQWSWIAPDIQVDGGPHTEYMDMYVEELRNVSDKCIKINMEKSRYWVGSDETPKPYSSVFSISFYTNDYAQYVVRCDPYERSIYSIKELILRSGIDDAKKIVIACAEHQYINKEAHFEAFDYTPGWNTIDGNTYYITSDGTIITKSVIIDDVRYKFTKDGVCHGKYSGFTRSKNGLRYYKDGVIIKNKCIRFTIADKDGYLTKQA